MDYKISIHHDDCAANPFKDWDCEPALIIGNNGYGHDDIEIYDVHNSHCLDIDYLIALTREQVKDNQSTLTDLLGYSTLRRGIAARLRYKFSWQNYPDLLDAISESLLEIYTCSTLSKKLEMYKQLLSIHGVITLKACSYGYVQSDYCEFVVVATPEFLKTTGAVITEPDDLKSSVKLFNNWAWGNCYGYVIEKIDRCDKCDAEHLEAEDSCYGFYGDIEENGMLENIPAELHDQARKAFKNVIY